MIGWGSQLCWRAATADAWIMHPPVNPYGDGYVAHLDVEIYDEGLYARTTATTDGPASATAASGLAAFVDQLAANWTGWCGHRPWHSLGRELVVDAWHDGLAHVRLRVTLRGHGRAHAQDGWSACALFEIEAGEQLRMLARDLHDLLTFTDESQM